MNDPLQTLYQQMSGRQPTAVTVSKVLPCIIKTVICLILSVAPFLSRPVPGNICLGTEYHFYCFQMLADLKWSDWRPHLAMMLSNKSSRPEADRKHIITLGDTLGTEIDLY